MGPQRLGSSACLSCDPELTCWRQAEQGGDLGESGTGAGGGRRAVLEGAHPGLGVSSHSVCQGG